TDLPEFEIQRLENLQGAELNEAKKILATEATALCHGRMAAEEAFETARRTFEEGVLAEGLPTFYIDQGPREDWKRGRSNTAIVFASQLVSSNSEARRKIAEGAIRINDRIVRDPSEIVKWTDVDPKLGAFKVQLGKRKIVLVKPKK
ncbi:MAG: tyrosine--tRNA ligase, partial [Alphaproteobacteria bacterium]|nr:tyrosine--tRNA ligase [Alphaproteobacteria bacterium]